MPQAPEAEEGRVTVCVRCRPLNERERRLNSPMCLLFSGGKTIRIFKNAITAGDQRADDALSGGKAFTFDHAYDSNVGQSTVYEDMGLPVLQASFRGFNTCIFAYGQTGSGKSYSMMGPSGGRDVVVDPGIIPLLLKDLFEMVAEQLADNRRDREAACKEGVEEHVLPPELTIAVVVSYLEIYHERVNCLLNTKCDNLKVREHPVLGVYVEGLTEVQVETEESVLRLMNGGNQSRHVAATKMNDRSSRSHAIFAISLIQKRKGKTKEGATTSTELRARINLVDLAGSERAKSTGAEGETLREGATINKSLTVLGLVISALAEFSKQKMDAPNSKHVPYRDSTLTFILKESLGGNSKTFMLSTVSPAAANYDETLSTLRYADRTKSIVTRAVVNETAGDKRIRELEDEVARLKEKMRHYEELVVRGVAADNDTKGRESKNALMNDMGAEDTMEDDTMCTSPRTPRAARDAAMLEAELHRAEELIQRLTGGDGSSVASPSVMELYRAMPTIKINRTDPFLLNVDGVGDWVMEYLIADMTYLGTEASDKGANTRYVVVSGENTAGIAPQHCCFVRRDDGRVLLRPLAGHITYINDESEPLVEDTLLTSGTVVCIGDEYVQFKFTDPSALSVAATARRRGTRGSESSFTNATGPKVSSASRSDSRNSTTPISSSTPVIPALRLKDALQRSSTSATLNPRNSASLTGGRSVSLRTRGATIVGVTPRTTMATGKVMFASNDEMSLMYRHTFLFLGPRNSGKTALRENIRKPDKWYSIFTNERVFVRPTFGVESFLVETPTAHHLVQMNMMELSGNGCFSFLEGLLPTRRATYVLCFSLREPFSLEALQPFLEFILCHATSRDVAVVLVGTHLDESSLGDAELVQYFADTEMEVNNYFRLLQVAQEMRPSIVGRFAVDNTNRIIISPALAKMKKFPDLLCWFAEQCIQRCRNDAEFPNAQIPLRVMALTKKIRELYREGKWCLSSSEYKLIAKAVDTRYGFCLDDLHRHTQLLVSWGVLHHHYRHLTMKKQIVVDVPWVLRVVAVLGCCTPARSNHEENDSAYPLLPFINSRAIPADMYAVFPFDIHSVHAADVHGVLNQGVITMRTAMALFCDVLAEKNFGPTHLTGLLDLLRHYDCIILGSSLKFSSLSLEPVRNTFPAKYNHRGARDDVHLQEKQQRRDDDDDDDDDDDEETEEEEEEEEGGDDTTSATTKPEMFVLVPACFTYQAPSAFCVHFPSFLFGPFYRFTLDMVPHNFFSRVVCRVAQYAEKMYLGPCSFRRVPVKDLVGDAIYSRGAAETQPAAGAGSSSSGGGGGGGGARAKLVDGTVRAVGKAQFWESTAWVISSSRSRALLRMVHHSLFITFHDFDDDEEFYDGLRHIVRNIVYESPGVVCEESILCSRRLMNEDEKASEVHGDTVYWRGVDENINSLEKIRQREHFALLTSRCNSARGPHLTRGADSKSGPDDNDNDSRGTMSDEEDDSLVIPFVQNRTGPLDVDAAVRRICADSLLTDAVLHAVTTSLQAMDDARRSGDDVKQCKAIDRLVDALAQA